MMLSMRVKTERKGVFITITISNSVSIMYGLKTICIFIDIPILVFNQKD